MVNAMRATDRHIGDLAIMLADCFADDRLVQLQTRGMNHPAEFLRSVMELQLDIFIRTQDVLILDERLKSVIIGYEKEQYNGLRGMLLSLLAMVRLRRKAGKDDLRLYKKNLRDVSKLMDMNWHRQYSRGNFYHINIIAVEREERGRGLMRSLLAPVVEHCNRQQIPIILETVNSWQVAVYEHFGFALARTSCEPHTGLTQYCFVKMPAA